MLKYVAHETETHQFVVGGYLEPVPGMVFPKNTVVIPTKKYCDLYFRPEDVEDLEPSMDIAKYKMNPCFVEYWNRAIRSRARNPLDHRAPMEIVRNFGTDPREVDLGPFIQDKTHHIKFLSYLTAKLTIPESMIEKMPIRQNLNTIGVYDEYGEMNPLLVSLNLLYFLSYCMFSTHIVENENLIDELPFNVIWDENIGLIATEPLSHPNPLTIFGVRQGSKAFYMSNVSSIPKTFHMKQVSLNQIGNQYGSTEMIRGGSDNCLS